MSGNQITIMGQVYKYHKSREITGKVKTFLKTSDGQDILSPEFFKHNAAAIKKANRKLSQKKKGSIIGSGAKIELARLHKKVSNCRKDFHFKLAGELCGQYAALCIEDLNIKAMQKLWGRKISDLGHAQFVNILKYQSAKTGSVVVEILRFYPSSKTCSECGHVLEELPLKFREWTCPCCGAIHDRDENAAKNILRVGASTLLGETA